MQTDFKFEAGDLVQHKASKVEGIVLRRYKSPAGSNWYEIETDFKWRIDTEEIILEKIFKQN